MMEQRKIFLIPLLFFGLLGGSSQIDTQIEQLEQMRLGYEGRALKHEYYAEYLQFNDRATLEYRRHLQLAEENRTKAAYIQSQIDELKAKRK